MGFHRILLSEHGEEEELNCTEPSINEFPNDLFTQEQRQNGYVAIHFVVTLYIFYALTIVCDYYFVPSVERIAKRLKIPSEIAGCTILGIANSSPELLTNVVGTFITHGDLGIGTIVGASVFNILAVGGCIGLFTKKVVPIQWWPITRDTIFYLLSVGVLFQALFDSRINWYDVAVLITLYLVYLLVIYFNLAVRRQFKRIVFWPIKKCQKRSYDLPITKNDASSNNSLSSSETDEELEKFHESASEPEARLTFWTLPYGQEWYKWVEWFVSWPIRAVLAITIPNFENPKWKNWYPFTFFMCVVWNTALCYIISWMVTVIGFTFGLSDSVMGLTVIAIGTSVPQVMSSLIVARKGYGTMAMNNAIGSNIFNILICLGVPWMIQILEHVHTHPYIQIQSGGLTYSTLMLLLSMVFLYLLLLLNKFNFDKKLGVIFLLGYLVFLVIGSLFELNVFFQVNLPTCEL